MKVEVALIDTEVHNHIFLKNLRVNNLWVSDPNKKCWHGTAVCGEIYKICKDINVDVFPVFSKSQTDPQEIIDVLAEILCSNKVYHIINMSFGIENSEWREKLQEICRKIAEKGTIIVSAFNNDGTMTYPACLESVIGVDVSTQISINDGYTYVENGAVNIIAPQKQKSVIFNYDKWKMVYGSSFACASITGMICKYISLLTKKYSKSDVLKFLESNASTVYKFSPTQIPECFSIKRAIIFPYTKETISILNLQRYLDFKIIGFYDLKYSIHCGENIKTFNGNSYQIQTVNSINWNSFDTVILGHIDNYLKLGLSNQLLEVIEKCIINNKHIYAFDGNVLEFIKNKFPNWKGILYYPYIDKKFFPHGQLGKMWNIPIPIITIAGTRSQQGKFTTQIQIFDCLKKSGYNPGLIASEPAGGLFKADYTFPYGYHNTVNIPQEEYAIYINDLMYKSYCKGRDIILSGLQFGVLPRNYYNMNQCTTMQFSLLFGMSPDIVILCVSPDDTIDLVMRTISAIESFSQALVLSIVVNPIIVDINSSGKIVKTNLEILKPEEYNKFIYKLAISTQKSVYKMNEENIDTITREILAILQE